MCNWEFQVGDCWTPSQAPNKQLQRTVQTASRRASHGSVRPLNCGVSGHRRRCARTQVARRILRRER
jgi:hypothetical protein